MTSLSYFFVSHQAVDLAQLYHRASSQTKQKMNVPDG